jgi:hypothetical protein
MRSDRLLNQLFDLIIGLRVMGVEWFQKLLGLLVCQVLVIFTLSRRKWGGM